MIITIIGRVLMFIGIAYMATKLAEKRKIHSMRPVPVRVKARR